MIEQMSATTSIFQIVKPYTHNGQIWEVYDSGATQNLAAKLGIDPVAIREMNMVKEGDLRQNKFQKNYP